MAGPGSHRSMLAVVMREPGGPGVLRVEEVPIPEARAGWVLVRVRAFGLNRSELTTRAGGSGDSVKLPRVLGIECVGEVVEAPGSDLRPGQRFVAVMGGMGRDYDGGYAQYALLPASQVVPVETSLEWPQLGALPESFGTAWGALEELALSEGQSLLVHGATSSIGMAAVTIAKARALTVLATTRQEVKREALVANGADHVIVVDGDPTDAAREILPDGVDGLCELIGPAGMVAALHAVAEGGRSCAVGFLEGDWNTEPAESEAKRLGIEYGRFGSGVIDRNGWADVFQEIVAGVERGRYRANLDRVFPISEIAEAHRYMEENRAAGKVVVLPPD